MTPLAQHKALAVACSTAAVLVEQLREAADLLPVGEDRNEVLQCKDEAVVISDVLAALTARAGLVATKLEQGRPTWPALTEPGILSALDAANRLYLQNHP